MLNTVEDHSTPAGTTKHEVSKFYLESIKMDAVLTLIDTGRYCFAMLKCGSKQEILGAML